MWKSENYDHQLIQSTAVEIEADQEGEDSRLLAYSTSQVFENYTRLDEWAVFQCELFTNSHGPGYEVRQTTRISKKSKSPVDSELIWAGKVSYFLNELFIPTLRGHQIGELARATINEYRNHLARAQRTLECDGSIT